MRKFIPSLIAAATFLFIGGICEATVVYIPTLLPGPIGAQVTQPLDINDTGRVVGFAYIGHDKSLPLEWTGGVLSMLPSPMGEMSAFPQKISNSGTVIGTVDPDFGVGQAVVWSNNELQYLPADGTIDSAPIGINAEGMIVGEAGFDSAQRAVLWSLPNFGASRPPANTYLPWQETNLNFSDGDESKAVAINDAGVIAGNIVRFNGPSSAFVMKNGVATDLGSLGADYTSASAMNEHGDVVGVSLLPSGYTDAFFWSNGQIADLGTLPGDDMSMAFAINDADEVVGISSNETTSIKPVVWIDGNPYNLNDLIPPDSGWVLRSAVSINNAGQIVGFGYYNNQQAAFLLTPTATITIPEPAAILLAPGFCLLASFRRRSRPRVRSD